MDAISLIPQLFYDLIGRVIPGATLLIYALIIFQGPEEAAKHLTSWSLYVAEAGAPSYKDLPTTMILLGNLLASYVIGALLGSLWNLISFIAVGQKHKERILEAFDTTPSGLRQIDLEKKGYIDKIAFIYDYIHLRYPKAGARMAKLRAEQLMCGSISIGAVLNGLVYFVYTVFFKKDQYSGRGLLFIEVALILIASTGILLTRHLERRCGNAMIDYWLLGSSEISEGK